MARTHCERCGQGLENQIAALEDCPFCGVVFAKLARKHQPIPARRRLPPHTAQSPARPVSPWQRIFEQHRETVQWWAKDRLFWPRLPVLIFMTYLGIRYLLNPEYRAIFDGINLGIHEAGHLVFKIFPTFIMFLGGTLLQLAAPILCGVLLFRQSDYFGTAFCGSWLGANFYNVAVYQADAQARLLPLVTVGGGVPMHDWYYMFSQMGILKLDGQIAFLTRAIAFTVIWASVVYGGWVARTIWLENKNP